MQLLGERGRAALSGLRKAAPETGYSPQFTICRASTSPPRESPSRSFDTSATVPALLPRPVRLSSRSPCDVRLSAARGESALRSLLRKGTDHGRAFLPQV